MWTTQLYSRNLYAKVIVLFVFILYIYPSYITAGGIFLHKEDKDYGKQLVTNDLKAYDDGTNKWGMIIDFDGKVLDRTYFKLTPYTLNLKLNINREKGFKNLIHMKLPLYHGNNMNEPMMSTVNEGYAYVYVLTSPKIDLDGLANDLLIAAVLIDYNKSESATVLLYHNHLQNIETENFNTNIESTFPKINDNLTFSDITNISINFYDPVILSDGKLSIYCQPDGQEKILRQSTSCITPAQCTLDNDDKRVTVKVLDSVLSKSGGIYFIKVDNNFIKDKVYEEPLLGIKENIWKFTINGSETQYPIISSISGFLRLNVDGTEIYQSKSNERNEFFNALLDELAEEVILIPRERLSKDSREQIEPGSKLLLFSITIDEAKNHDEKDVNTAMLDLKNMMENSDQTFIGQGNYTKYLDSTFGFQPKPNYWEEYKFKLLGALLAIIILIILYFLACLRSKNKKKESHNFAIFQFALIIFGFVMDILYITNNANDFPKLYIPSLIFFALPITLNTILAFLIITKENAKSDSKFSKWFNKNIKLASIFTILAGADIEILNLLHSNLARLEIFNAPLSASAEHKVFWG
ncbi:hypothetical protein RclHR1_16700003 [Rhizophagus clarus]|uniref:Uncharacterized protein n=1 Tax=Rhizophagus clarus TaxID=94130 RepID=A0A2Z6QI74_9GLOM|nr:hypothetical protein RclHR1_16700003 [Rhizophagus clarus]